MGNPLLNQMNAQALNNYTQRIGQLYKQFSSLGNPMNMLAQMAQGNPKLQPIVQNLQRGVNPEQIFRGLCQDNGINADEFMAQIRNNIR